MHVSSWSLSELVEAAARRGRPGGHRRARTLAEMAAACGTDWVVGVEARARALVADLADAEELYRHAIECLGRTRLRSELARAHLLYGEWLRRDRRRLDARDQLRQAQDMFTSIGMEAFAARAGRELLATGETARKRTVQTRDELTAQEARIARFARDGFSNAEIGARLFISPRTVEYHLHKVFTKLAELDIWTAAWLDPGRAARAGLVYDPGRPDANRPKERRHRSTIQEQPDHSTDA